MSINKILVPTDFSEAAETAAAFAVRIADASNSSLTFVHVHDDKNRITSYNVCYTKLLRQAEQYFL